MQPFFGPYLDPNLQKMDQTRILDFFDELLNDCLRIINHLNKKAEGL